MSNRNNLLKQRKKKLRSNAFFFLFFSFFKVKRFQETLIMTVNQIIHPDNLKKWENYITCVIL